MHPGIDAEMEGLLELEIMQKHLRQQITVNAPLTS